MWYAVLADLVVAFHSLVIGYVVVGQLVITAAAPFRWQPARNPWFRFTHLGIIAYVVYEQFHDIRCFLSVWEEQLKELAGVPFDSSATFLGRFARDVLYVNLPQNDTVFTVLYVAAFVVVLQGLVMYPPRLWRKPGRRPELAPALAVA
ncbi:MAG: DUF2784 domain-containing protein [Gemmataceae bacterium]|nr:DUF2784 domain-containing protein [Gemmataceae bacterium]